MTIFKRVMKRSKKAFNSSICGGYEEKAAINDVLHNLVDSST